MKLGATNIKSKVAQRCWVLYMLLGAIHAVAASDSGLISAATCHCH